MTSQEHISDQTPLGAHLVADGATFRVWAPRALAVHVVGSFNQWKPAGKNLLRQFPDGYWAGFIGGIRGGDEYNFFVRGPGGEGIKRDPDARELTLSPPFPDCHCVVLDPSRFPWHDQKFQTPDFSDLVIYQLHVGTFSISPSHAGGKFLDVAERLPYLGALGINAIQPLPIDEFPTSFSLGYNGTDYFSPETDYAVNDETELKGYLSRLNSLLLLRNLAPYRLEDLKGGGNQLRALVDLAHVFSMAVLFDVVYNHAGGGFDDHSLYFFDQMPRGDNNDSLYFTSEGWAGGLVYAYWNKEVLEFLMRNADFYLQECHADGFRFDEVSVMDRFGGWNFCQQLTTRIRERRPRSLQIAEYWPVNQAVIEETEGGGAGFDACLNDGLRESLRRVAAQAALGQPGPLPLNAVAEHLRVPGFAQSWRAVQCLENHDIVKEGEQPRLARLCDPGDSRSWYGRSRARCLNGLLMAAPGIPMIFMGQEILEDKQWSDNPANGHQLWWNGLESGDREMVDHLRFMQELIWVRRRFAALRAGSINVFHVHEENRVIAFHRWVEGQGRDVVVVANLGDTTFWSYKIGFPLPGRWIEVMNSDVYYHWVNPWTAGNGGGIVAAEEGAHGLPASAPIVIPGNGILIFARERGDL